MINGKLFKVNTPSDLPAFVYNVFSCSRAFRKVTKRKKKKLFLFKYSTQAEALATLCAHLVSNKLFSSYITSKHKLIRIHTDKLDKHQTFKKGTSKQIKKRKES